MTSAAMLLFPGAGTSCEHPGLVSIEHRLGTALAAMACRRADFPYRRAGRRAPDRPTVLVRALRDEAADVLTTHDLASTQLVLGGRSMGGRLCSLVAAGPGPGAVDDAPALAVAGLVLIAYPLHPPGKPDRLRVEHFPRLTMPCLFVQGTRDPFAQPDELQAWTTTIPGPVTHRWIEGGRHELRGADDEVACAVVDWCADLPGVR